MRRSQMLVSRTEVVAEQGLVAAGHPAEAEAGVRLLQAGGNAVDAVLAAAFTGYVVEPASCGLGGYGRLALYLAERDEFVTIDHYARAPHRAWPTMFTVDEHLPPQYYGWPRVVGRRNEWGGLAPAVPGAVAGLCEAHRRHGRLPLAQVLEPAIEAAEAGVPVTWSLVLAIAGRLEQIQAMPVAADWLLRRGCPPRVAAPGQPGDRLDCSELASTLRRIAAHGPAAFYTGPVAEAIERTLTDLGGVLTTADLTAYRPKVLREIPGVYRDHRYITAYDQVGQETLNILSHFDLGRLAPDSLTFRHLMAEAAGHAFADNMLHYGDPDHTRAPVNGLGSPAFAARRAAAIRLDRAAPRPILAGDPWPYEAAWPAPERLPTGPSSGGVAGTSQMAAVDRHGNIATLITSLTSAFGSLVLVPGTGVFLNNCMQNFDPRPDRANAIAPGKMPIFAVPSLVSARDGRPGLGVCGSGGYRILSGVLHTFCHAVDCGLGLQAAVDAPRVHCQGDETYVDDRIDQTVQARLAAMGHRIVPQAVEPGGFAFGRVCAVGIDRGTGLRHGGAGPAWATAVAGY